MIDKNGVNMYEVKESGVALLKLIAYDRYIMKTYNVPLNKVYKYKLTKDDRQQAILDMLADSINKRNCESKRLGPAS